MADSQTTDHVIEIDPRCLALLRGRKAFRNGKPKPQDIWTDEQWSGALNERQCELLGWMLARSDMLTAQWKVRAYLEEGADL